MEPGIYYWPRTDEIGILTLENCHYWLHVGTFDYCLVLMVKCPEGPRRIEELVLLEELECNIL